MPENNLPRSGDVVETPNYKPITQRTYFLEGKRLGKLPENLKYSQFLKERDKYLPKEISNDFPKYKHDQGVFKKNFPQIQTTPTDVEVFKRKNIEIPKGQNIAAGKIAYKTGGRITKEYIKENKDKQGGSNIGKPTLSDGKKRTGPYVGPAGGAPKGSYPIPDLKRAKAALSYAKNAPNPEGIKKAVYEKYPSLAKYKEGGNIDLPKNIKDLPIIQDPLELAGMLHNLRSNKTLGFKVGYPEILKTKTNISSKYKYPFTHYTKITDKSGNSGYFPVLTTEQHRSLTKEFKQGGKIYLKSPLDKWRR